MKKDIEDLILKYADGDLDLLNTVNLLNEFKLNLEECLSLIRDFYHEWHNEIEIQAKEFNNEFNGVKYEFRKGRTTYNYKGIKEIEDLKKKLKEVEEKYKKAFISNQKGLTIVDSYTGEILPLPTAKESRSSLILKKY